MLVLGDGTRADILFQRTSSRPIEYAIILRRVEGERRSAVICADNSHADVRVDVDEHHFHRYRRTEKGPPLPLPFPVTDVNDALHKIIAWMSNNWEELLS